MTVRYDIAPPKSLEERYDFASIKTGASLWFEFKKECAEVTRHYEEWSKRNGACMTTSFAEVGKDDPDGPGFRLWFTDPDMERLKQGDVDIYLLVRMWVKHRLVYVAEEPAGGWPMTGRLYEDFMKWSEQYGGDRSTTKNVFGRVLKTVGTISVRRRAQGTVVVNRWLRSDEI